MRKHVTAKIIDRFVEEATRQGATVHRVRDWVDVVAQIAAIVVHVAECGVHTTATWPVHQEKQLAAALADRGLWMRSADARTQMGASTVGLTRAEAGIAATGTLVCVDTSEQGRLVSMLSGVHIAILEESRIVAELPGVEPLMTRTLARGPSFVAMITGPSRTADIERELTIGVHGPKSLHIVLHGGSDAA